MKPMNESPTPFARCAVAAPPLEPLALTVQSVQPPDLADPTEATRRRTVAGRLRMLLVLAACAAPVVASYLGYYVFKPEARTNYGALVDPPRAWPASLQPTALDGAPVAPAALRDQWLLVAVGPAACDAPCERRLFMQRQLREMLGRERDRLDKLWLVTDAAPLKPELQRALAAAPATTVLRVPAEALARWLEPAAGRALQDHFYVVDPRGQWMLRLPADPDPARVKRDLERLLRASASWDRPGR
jgi:cytochrome oxidase Cu insertion factor (SCO1/SenC/PrrC family)